MFDLPPYLSVFGFFLGLFAQALLHLGHKFDRKKFLECAVVAVFTFELFGFIGIKEGGGETLRIMMILGAGMSMFGFLAVYTWQFQEVVWTRVNTITIQAISVLFASSIFLITSTTSALYFAVQTVVITVAVFLLAKSAAIRILLYGWSALALAILIYQNVSLSLKDFVFSKAFEYGAFLFFPLLHILTTLIILYCVASVYKRRPEPNVIAETMRVRASIENAYQFDSSFRIWHAAFLFGEFLLLTANNLFHFLPAPLLYAIVLGVIFIVLAPRRIDQ